MTRVILFKHFGRSPIGIRMSIRFIIDVPFYYLVCKISNGNRTEWSPIRSVIIQVITKSDDRAAGVRFVYERKGKFALNTDKGGVNCFMSL